MKYMIIDGEEPYFHVDTSAFDTTSASDAKAKYNSAIAAVRRAEEAVCKARGEKARAAARLCAAQVAASWARARAEDARMEMRR